MSNKSNIFPVYVDYDLLLEKAIKNGKYDWVNPNIDNKNFPTKRFGSAEINIHLVYFKKEMHSEDALKELDKIGLRPAEFLEILVLGAKYPDEQKRNLIIALGSLWNSSGGMRVPRLWGNYAYRCVGLDYFGDIWCPGCQFASIELASYIRYKPFCYLPEGLIIYFINFLRKTFIYEMHKFRYI